MCLSWILIDMFLKFFKNRNWRCNFCTLLEHFYGSICSLMPLRINAQNSFAREAKFTEKHLCLSLFLIKLHVLFKRDSNRVVMGILENVWKYFFTFFLVWSMHRHTSDCPASNDENIFGQIVHFLLRSALFLNQGTRNLTF